MTPSIDGRKEVARLAGISNQSHQDQPTYQNGQESYQDCKPGNVSGNKVLPEATGKGDRSDPHLTNPSKCEMGGLSCQ